MADRNYLNIKDLMKNEGSKTFYDKSFRNMIEDHIPLFKTSSDTDKVTITPQQMYKYEFDLYGLLMELGYTREYHWIILRTNDLHNYSDFSKKHSILLIPDTSRIRNLMKVFKARESYI